MPFASIDLLKYRFFIRICFQCRFLYFNCAEVAHFTNSLKESQKKPTPNFANPCKNHIKLNNKQKLSNKGQLNKLGNLANLNLNLVVLRTTNFNRNNFCKNCIHVDLKFVDE